MNEINNIGLSKIKMAKTDPKRFFIRSILAGFYLGGAMILSYSLGSIFSFNPAISKLCIAATFGIGLVAICYLGAELFTGNCFCTIIPVYDRKIKGKELIPAWILCYIGNAIGMILIGILFVFSQKDGTLLSAYLDKLYLAKMNFTYFPLFIKAVLCNFAVCIAAYSNIKIKEDFPKIVITMFFVGTFVIAGFEHCIANIGFFTMVITEYGLGFDYSLLFIHMVIATIGNIVGGSILFALPIYMIERK